MRIQLNKISQLPSEAAKKLYWMFNQKFIGVFYLVPSEAIKRTSWLLDRKPAGGFQ